MKPDEALKPVADKVKKGSEDHAGSIPLDQPFPEEFPAAPTLEKDKAATKEEERKDDEPAKILDPSQDNKSDEPPTIAGYKPENLLKAPLEPPEPVKTESRRATMNGRVLFLVALGAVLLVLGIVLIVSFNAVFGALIALLGAIAVVISVFAPLR